MDNIIPKTNYTMHNALDQSQEIDVQSIPSKNLVLLDENSLQDVPD